MNSPWWENQISQLIGSLITMNCQYLVKTPPLSQECHYFWWKLEHFIAHCLSCHHIFGTVIFSLKSTAFALEFCCACKNHKKIYKSVNLQYLFLQFLETIRDSSLKDFPFPNIWWSLAGRHQFLGSSCCQIVPISFKQMHD